MPFVILFDLIKDLIGVFCLVWWFSYRGLQFIREFLKEILNNQQDLSLAASNAYSRSLKPFHGWVVRGVFAVSTCILYIFDDIIQILTTHEVDIIVYQPWRFDIHQVNGSSKCKISKVEKS